VVKDASEKFHVYKADWTPEKIDVYIDSESFSLMKIKVKTMKPGLLISLILSF
jgi:beta-glucanase (GH16 family)